MRRLRLILVTLFIGSFSAINAQSVDKAVIIASEDYYYGESCNKNQREAEKDALNRLSSSISVTVSGDFRSAETLETADDEQSFTANVEKVVNTYTTSSFKNLQSIKNKLDCGISVFYYVKKSEWQEIVDNRKKLAGAIFNKAAKNQENHDYANALKYYYFSYILLNSIPETNIEHDGYILDIEIGSRISEIAKKARFEVIEDELVSPEKREITLAVSVDGNSADYLDYHFWDGNNNVFSKTQDGVSRIILLGSSVQFPELQLEVKYSYFSSKDEIKQVSDLWDIIKPGNFANTQTIDLNRAPTVSDVVDLKKVEGNERLLETTNDGVETEPQNIKDNVLESLEKIVPRNLKLLSNYFNDGRKNLMWEQDSFLSDKLNRLEKYNNINILEKSIKQDINKTYEGWEFRQLSSDTYYSSLNMQSQEYLIPDFDSLGTLTDVNFGIINGLYDGFKNSAKFGKDWDRRQIIIKFVEKYRTAYLSRDLEQLEVMFAEEAVIIVGRVLKKDLSAAQSYELNQVNDSQPDVQYLKLKKEDFLTRQKSIFEAKRDIHLGFTTFDINRKNNDKNVFGVAMRQSYISDGYADEGYLFLLIDFNGNEPKIYVRAWQPQEWSEEDLIGLSNFRLSF
ncbi:MAG: hypothetical protein RJQ00_14085 [Vicingaceae bacterium]|jgi:hypothetical protein